jgi:hypothetical protein
MLAHIYVCLLVNTDIQAIKNRAFRFVCVCVWSKSEGCSAVGHNFSRPLNAEQELLTENVQQGKQLKLTETLRMHPKWILIIGLWSNVKHFFRE